MLGTVPSSVDAKNKLAIDYKVTNSNDSKAMGNMLQRAKSILRTNQFTALYGKGYHTGSEFKIAQVMQIETLVAIPNQTVHAPDPTYGAEKFSYIPEGDYYICPQGQHLTTTGKWHKASAYRFKRYATRACKSCSVKKQDGILGVQFYAPRKSAIFNSYNSIRQEFLDRLPLCV